MNPSAVERRAVTIPTRRTVKNEWQAAWLLRAILPFDPPPLPGPAGVAETGAWSGARGKRQGVSVGMGPGLAASQGNPGLIFDR